MFNPRLLGAFRPSKVSFRAISIEVVFVAAAIRILEILLSALSYFLRMFCMKCVLWVNINYPKAKNINILSIRKSQLGHQFVSINEDLFSEVIIYLFLSGTSSIGT